MRANLYQWTLFVNFIFLSLFSNAQAPAQFNFQGAARDIFGSPVVAKNVALRFSIRTGTANGAIEYQESRSVLTDYVGVFNAVIGGAGATKTIGSLKTVLWDTGAKFLQVEMDPKDGNAFINLGATQLLSVPYALFSNISNHATLSDSSQYASSSGSYFFEVVFPDGHTRLKDDVLSTLIFPRSTYNAIVNEIGGSRPVYDTTTGAFKAPEGGIYQFDFAIATTDEHRGDEIRDDGFYEYVDIFFYKNGKLLKEIFVSGRYDTNLRLRLAAGDVIKIMYQSRGRDINNDYRLEPDGEEVMMNYFSGYKIK